MKFTNTNELAPATFKVGDFFLNDCDKLRRLILVDGKYGILDVERGNLAINRTDILAKDMINHYVKHNGEIRKVEVQEIKYAVTGGKLNEIHTN